MDNSNAIVLKALNSLGGKNTPMSLWEWFKLYSSTVGFIYLALKLFIYPYIDGIALMFFLGVIFVVIIVISRIRHRTNYDESINDIRSMKFKLNASATVAEIYDKLVLELPKVEKFFSEHTTIKRESEKVVVTFKGANYEIDYEIILNGDETFSVIGKSSSLLDNKALYEDISWHTAIIAFGLQQAFGIN